MNVVEQNLCEVVVNEMTALGFNPKNIEAIKNNPKFVEVLDKQSQFQRTVLTMMFYNILISGTHPAPPQIRIALNIATDVVGWTSDVRLVILPFMKANEDKFFV